MKTILKCIQKAANKLCSVIYDKLLIILLQDDPD